jgi:hypothetical protein
MEGQLLSDDAMAAIKARRTSLLRDNEKALHDEAIAAQRLAASQGVRAFSSWFAKERAAGEIVMSADRMLNVQPTLSARFCVGLFESRYYLGLPEDVVPWFRDMPWLHAALIRATSSLSLVCERTRLPDVTLPEFSLNFDVGSPAIVKSLSHYHYLDVRAIRKAATDRPDGRRDIEVARDVLMTLDIRVVTGAETFRDLLDGREAHGFSNRHPFQVFERRVTDGVLREFGPPLELAVPKTVKSAMFKRVKSKE